MKTKKVVLVNTSRLMHDFLEKFITKTAGLDFAAQIGDLESLPQAITSTGADLAIVLLPPGEQVPQALKEIIGRYSSTRFLLMGSDGSQARLHWNEPHEVPVDELSVQELKDMLRANQPERNEILWK